jgi:dUTP pyrophosphatase
MSYAREVVNGTCETGMLMEVKIKILDPRARIPERQHPDDAGFDLASLEGFSISPNDRIVVPTGLALELPRGACALVLPRSGLAAKYGLTLANAPGLIDSNYRGELKIALVNLGNEEISLPVGARVAQLVVLNLPAVMLQQVEELSGSDRGDGGFGHTGV